MSHFVRVRSKVKNINFLKKALQRIGLNFVEENFIVNQYNQTEEAQICLDPKNKSVGLQLQSDGTWSLVGDPYHAPHSSKIYSYYGKNEKFVKDLQLAYLVEESNDKLKQLGFECIENEQLQEVDGKIISVYESSEY